MSVDEETIGTSKGNVHCKSPFLAYQLSVFFALVRYRVVKIAHCSSEVVLRTIKHMVIYPGLGLSLEVRALHPST
jgi:hypothetical protein